MLETFVVVSLIGTLVTLLLVYPTVPDLYLFRGGLGYGQAVAAYLREALGQTSFWRLWAAGWLPSQKESYQGLLMAYFYLPFEILFDSKWWLYSFWHVGFAVPIMVFTYLSVRDLFGRGVGLLTLAFLVVHPGFVSGMRIGGELSSYMLFFSTGAMFFFIRWWNRRNTISYFLAFLCLLGGMVAKMWFHWTLAVFSLIVLLYAREIRNRFSKEPALRSALSIFLGVAALGSGIYLADPGRIADLIPFGRFSWSGSVRQLFDSFWHSNLVLSSAVFRLNEPFLTHRIWLQNEFFPYVLWGSSALMLIKFADRGKRFMFFPLALLSCMFLPPIIGDHIPAAYPFFFYPIPQIIIAAAAVEIFRLPRARKSLITVFGIFMIFFVGREIYGLTQYFGEMERYGFNKNQADASRQLVRRLKESGSAERTVLWYNPVAARDEVYRWRLSYMFPDLSLRFLFLDKETAERSGPSGGLNVSEVGYSMYETPKAGELAVVIVDKTASDGSADFSRWPVNYRRRLVEMTLVARTDRFFGKDGVPVFDLYRSSPPGSAPVQFSLIPDWRKSMRIVQPVGNNAG